jgi:ribosomal protein S18 acetylase RimI-like enzyme
VAQDDPAISRALLHVHAANSEALEWYQARGFEVAEVVRGYYSKLQPPDAVVLRKQLQPAPAAGSGDGGGDGGGARQRSAVP